MGCWWGWRLFSCWPIGTGSRGGLLPGLVWQGVRTALPVVAVMLCIGCLTALWRASGTIGYCVAVGLELLAPRLFLLIAFLLPAVLSFLLGTSFGVAGTAGVVLMALARSGGADLPLTAGAVLSGAYFGDRCSPASSAGMLACKVCDVPHSSFVRMMLRTSVGPDLGLPGGIQRAFRYPSPGPNGRAGAASLGGELSTFLGLLIARPGAVGAALVRTPDFL